MDARRNALEITKSRLEEDIATATHALRAMLRETVLELQAIAQAEEEERERKRRWVFVVVRTIKHHDFKRDNAVAAFDTLDEAMAALPMIHHLVKYRVVKLQIGNKKDIIYNHD